MERSKVVEITLHDHPLEEVGISENKWYCDSLNVAASKSCIRGHKPVFILRGHSQYHCKKSCNFTMCDLCVELYKKDSNSLKNR